MSIRSSSLKRPPTSTPILSRASWTSGSSSVSSIATASPSAFLPTKAMSITRIVPASMSSPMAGAISPRNRFPGNAITAKSTGPISSICTSFYDAASAFALMASNSACVIAPESRRPFAFSISAAAPPLPATLRT